MEHPAKINNDAVGLMGAGRYEEAILELGESLKGIKLIMSGDAKMVQCDDDMSDDCVEDHHKAASISCDFVTSSPQVPMFQRTGHMPPSQEKCGRRSTTSATTMSSVYQACMVLRGVPSTECSSSRSLTTGQCDLVSYAILYNLALAHHLLAIQVLSSSESRQGQVQIVDLLHKAMTLYEHSHHILMNHQSNEADFQLIHPMAIANNLGHAYEMLGDRNNTRLCFDHLLSTILYAVDCGEGQDINALDGFFKNVMPLVMKSTSSPAAAA